MTLASLKSAVDLGINEEGLEEIRKKINEFEKMHPSNIEERDKKSERKYQNNQNGINRLVFDIFETPEDFFEGTGVNPITAHREDIYRTRVAITEYLMENH